MNKGSEAKTSKNLDALLGMASVGLPQCRPLLFLVSGGGGFNGLGLACVRLRRENNALSPVVNDSMSLMKNVCTKYSNDWRNVRFH